MDGTSTYAQQLASMKDAQRDKGKFVPIVIKNEQGKNGDSAPPESEGQRHGIRVEILVTEGPAKGKRFVLDKPTYFLFGRRADAHLSIPNDQYVSRQHFALQISEEECRLRDLNSKNGVIVNGVRYGGRTVHSDAIRQAPINEVCLQNGDQISIGTTHIQVNITPLLSSEPIRPQQKRQSQDAALFVLDLVKSTEHLLKVGDQVFSALIGRFRARFQEHRSSSELLSLKCTGDGFLAVYRSPSAAFALATDLLQTPVNPEIHIRMALHWGTVTSIPDGTFIGRDVQKIYHLEGLQAHDQISSSESTKMLPPANRILVTHPALKRLNKNERLKCRAAGQFRLEELNESCRLWVHVA